MLEQKISASGWISDSALTAIGRQAYDELLGHLRSKYTRDVDPGLLRDVNGAMRDMFALLEAGGGAIDLTPEWDSAFLELGHGERLGVMRAVLAHYDNGRAAVPEEMTCRLLEQHGVSPSRENMSVVHQQLLTTFREAFETAGERLRADFEEPAGGPVVQSSAGFAVAASPGPAVALTSFTISDAAEECIRQNLVDKIWKEPSCIQVRTAVRMFVYANGDIPVSSITQAHLGAFDDLCFRLPTKWNRTTDERERGLVASLERAKGLHANQVGLSAKSREKHFTWLAAVIGWAGSKGKGKPAEDLDFKSLRKGKKSLTAEHELRLSWTADELRGMFRAPVWHGSAGLFDRLTPGEQVWHDAWYWGPIALPLTGLRSDELVGCSLAEIHEDHAIPHFALKETAFRSLKGIPSRRKVPIPSELIRLGFLDYVRALRGLGEELLFPELYLPKNKSGFDSTFYKVVFSKLRAASFPQGTTWFQEQGGGEMNAKEKDVHSFRGSTSNLLLAAKVEDPIREDLLGHRGKTTTRKIYDEPTELTIKREALDKLSFLTTNLTARPLNLRPAEWLKYGQPRGRPVNGGRPSLPRRRMWPALMS